jgi:predicted metal-dependent hydrolase
MIVPAHFVARDRKLRLSLLESSRRRTLSIEVHPHARDGAQLVVRAPQGLAWSEVEARLVRRSAWIVRQALRFDQYRPQAQPRQYLAGESVRLLGRQHVLKVEKGTCSVILQGQRLGITVPHPDDRNAVARVLNTWLRDKAKTEFAHRLAKWLNHPLFQLPPCLRIQVRTLSRRWGSLSAAGTLTLNPLLVEATADCIDYVLVHELCHYWHPNHGKDFFLLLDDVMPDWAMRKARLERFMG